MNFKIGDIVYWSVGTMLKRQRYGVVIDAAYPKITIQWLDGLCHQYIMDSTEFISLNNFTDAIKVIS